MPPKITFTAGSFGNTEHYLVSITETFSCGLFGSKSERQASTFGGPWHPGGHPNQKNITIFGISVKNSSSETYSFSISSLSTYSSGYHIRLTRGRSPVRSRTETSLLHCFYGISIKNISSIVLFLVSRPEKASIIVHLEQVHN